MVATNKYDLSILSWNEQTHGIRTDLNKNKTYILLDTAITF